MSRHHDSRHDTVMHSMTHRIRLVRNGLSVAGEHRIEEKRLDSILVRAVVADWGVRERDVVWPSDERELPETFAQVKDEASILEFNNRYGLLGFELSLRLKDNTFRGEPVAWVLAHAKTVAAVLGIISIIESVRTGRIRISERSPQLLKALIAECGKMQMKVEEDVGKEGKHYRYIWKPPEAVVFPELRETLSPNWGRDPIGTAYYVLSCVLNRYTQNIHPKFVSLDYTRRLFGMPSSVPSGFGLEFNWWTLRDAIYWQLAQKIRGEFRICPQCGFAFPTVDERQIYCCAEDGAAFRSRRYRAARRIRKTKNRQAKRR